MLKYAKYICENTTECVLVNIQQIIERGRVLVGGIQIHLLFICHGCVWKENPIANRKHN